MAFRASRQVHTSLRAWRLPPSVIARQLHGSHACAEQLFNAERVKQYEKLNKVPDKESALKELDQLGKPGGKSVVEFYFGENNSASVIASVNTIAHPAVAEDELLLYATRKNMYLNLAEFGMPVPWWQIGLAFGATGLMFVGSWRALAGEAAALILTNGGTHVRIHPFNLLARPSSAGVTVPVRLVRGVTGSAGIGRVVGGGAAGRTAGSPLSSRRYSELDASGEEVDTASADNNAGDAAQAAKPTAQAGSSQHNHELIPVLGQGNGTTAYATPRFFAVAPPDSGEAVAAGILGKQMVLDFRNGLSNVFSYHDTLLEQVMQGRPVSIPAWKAAVEGTAGMGDGSVKVAQGAAVTAAAAAAPVADGDAYWKEAIDGEGNTYFYNEITRESRWELPGKR